MIVRISTEGQYRFPDEEADRLNDLDNGVVEAIDAGDEDAFHERFEELLALVRAEGSVLDGEELEGSDVILPPPDTSFVEASEEFTRGSAGPPGESMSWTAGPDGSRSL